MMPRLHRTPSLTATVALIAALAAPAWLVASSGTAHAQGQAMPVTVAKPVARKVVDTADFSGRFQAAATVQITSRVSGYLETATFIEGATVNAGDVLFTIDARPFQAALDQTKAQVQAAQTKLDLARANLTRSEELRKSGNIAESAYQSSQQAFLEAQANADSSKAALASTALDLSFAKIKAPISGKIGRKLIAEGNLVVGGSQGQGTVLTTIVSVDPIYFYFDIDETSYLAYQRTTKPDAGPGDETRTANISLPDEKDFSHKGRIDYIAPLVDTATGTVTVRAVVKNANGFLTPGLFGRVRVALSTPYDAMILPDEAVGVSTQGNYVVVASADGTVGIKPVVAGPKLGAFRAVKSGLTADDQVIVNGLMRARPGGKVIPQLTELNVPADLIAAASNASR